MKKSIDFNIRLIESAYKENFKVLFACAYLITANERAAESVLMKVILSNPVPEEKDFDDIFSLVKELSLKAALPEDSALFGFSGDMSNITNSLGEWMLTLDEKKARILVLRYALNLSVKEICLVTGEKGEKVKSLLERGKARAYNEGSGQKASILRLKSACRELAQSACFPPDFNAILHSVERIIEDQNASSIRSFSVKPIISYLVTGVLMLLIAAIVWMSVVLIDYFREPVQATRPVFPISTDYPENTEG